MERAVIDIKRISKDIEGLDVKALKDAFKRYKKTTSKFRNLNVRDPLDYLDFEVNLQAELVSLKEEILHGNYSPRRPQVHFAPKKKGISRPTVTLKIEDAVVYRFCLEQMDEQIVEITRQKNIHGGVMASPVPNPEDGEYYEKWFKDWLEHNAAVFDALKYRTHLATTDISSYFDNVNVNLLIELLRAQVHDKPNLIDFLAFFLSNVRLRYGYSTTLDTGLVQDDTDCSRILAYFYLHTHDSIMIEHGRRIDADFFRYVDDMNVAVNSETDAKLSLRVLTNSLREIGLTASIEKTDIRTREQALEDMLKSENEILSDLENRISYALNYDEDYSRLEEELRKLFEEMLKNGYDTKSTWIKLLRRFYTLASRLQSDLLVPSTLSIIQSHPDIASSGKLARYLLICQKTLSIDGCVIEVIQYLDSNDNLYPQVETQLLEFLANLDISRLDDKTVEDVANWSRGRFNLGNKDNFQSDFARGMNVYLLYKFDKTSNVIIAQQYLENRHFSDYHRKCLAIVSLTVTNQLLRKKVETKTRMHVSPEMKRLMHFIDGMQDYKKENVIKKYLDSNEIVVYASDYENAKGEKDKKFITVPADYSRILILKDLVGLYG